MSSNNAHQRKEEESKMPAGAKRCLSLVVVSDAPKKTKVAFMDMLDENSLSLIVPFVAESSEMLVPLRKVNKQFLKAVDSALFWRERQGSKSIPRGIVQDTLVANGHASHLWHSSFGLESFAFYEQVVAAGLFEKKKVVTEIANKLLPKSVSRILQLYRILESFPRIEADWKQLGMLHCDEQGSLHLNVVAAIVYYMIVNEILPQPDIVNVDEHCNIIMSGAKKYRHVIYQEYKGSVAANLFQRSTPFQVTQDAWSCTPVHLKLLIATGNKGKRW